MTIWTGNSALQVLPDSRKGQRNIGRPGSWQDVSSPRADRMSSVPVRLGPPSSGRLTDPMTSCRQRSE